MIYDILENCASSKRQARFSVKALKKKLSARSCSGASGYTTGKISDKKIGHRVIGNRVIPVGAGGGASDASEFLQAKSRFSAIVYGPGTNTSHEADEYVEVEQFLQATELYRKLALAFLERYIAQLGYRKLANRFFSYLV